MPKKGTFAFKKNNNKKLVFPIQNSTALYL